MRPGRRPRGSAASSRRSSRVRVARSLCSDHRRPETRRSVDCWPAPGRLDGPSMKPNPSHPTGRILRRVARALAMPEAGDWTSATALYDARRRARMNDTRRSARRHETNLAVLLADEDEDALESLGGVLRSSGHEVTPFAVSVAEAAELIGREDPDLDDRRRPPGRRARARADRRGRRVRLGPRDRAAARPRRRRLRRARRRARHLGLCRVQRRRRSVQAAIEVAIRRYREAARLNEKVDQLETRARAPRGHRARQGDPDGAPRHRRQAAFGRLRDHARSGNRRVVDVAQAVVDGHALLPARATQD